MAFVLEESGTNRPTVCLHNDGQTALVVYGRDYESPEAAISAGKKWRRHLLIALACFGVGAEFGDDRNPWRPSQFALAASQGKGVALSDYQLLVYEQDFKTMLDQTRKDYPPIQEPRRLEALVEGPLAEVAQTKYTMTEQQELSYNLLHAAFFESNPETKNVTLVTAMEAIIEQSKRSPEIVKELDALIVRTKSNSNLSSKARDIIMNAIGNVKRQSINEAGQSLAAGLLHQSYDGLPPDEFFKRSYVDRCSLVHGSTKRPSPAVLNARNPILLGFVADLLHAFVFGSRSADR